MQTSTESQIEARLRKLERQNRLLLGALAVMLLTSVGAIITGCVSPGQAANAASPAMTEVQAQRFVLKDEKGVVQGSWGMENGVQVFRFGSSTGSQRLWMRADDTTTTIGIRSSGELQRLSLQAGPASGVELHGQNLLGGDKHSDFFLRAGGGAGLLAQVDGSSALMQAQKNGANLDLGEKDKIRASLGKGHYTGHLWALDFKDSQGVSYYRIPANPQP